MRDEEMIEQLKDQLLSLSELAEEINESLKSLEAPLADHFPRTIENQIKEIERQIEEEI